MTKSPPVPPANRSPAGPSDKESDNADLRPSDVNVERVPENLDQQDHQANIKQNTTNQKR